jgi:curli production assembly/transport component CsgG
VSLLSSCASHNLLEGSGGIPNVVIKSSSIMDLQNEELLNIKPAKRKPVIAIYPNSFKDMTGQRKSNGSFALFSTAITQAPEAYLIRALKHASNGEFFQVAERVGLADLTKERQLIRSTRESFEEDSRVKPLLLAGLLMQGGVLSIDTNVRSGGTGARYLGIGSSKEYREDLITISLRLVSVSTGEVLIEVLTTKNILSVGLSQDIFRFLDESTRLIEVEGGVSANESTSIALQKAIEDSVLEIIKIGIDKKYWVYKNEL